MKKKISNNNFYKTYKNYQDAFYHEYDVWSDDRLELDDRYSDGSDDYYIYYYNTDGVKLCRTSDKNKIREEKINIILNQ
jgi:hypothetical protein